MTIPVKARNQDQGVDAVAPGAAQERRDHRELMNTAPTKARRPAPMAMSM